MKKTILAMAIITALAACGSESSDNQVQTPDALLNQLLETDGVNITSEANFSDYVQKQWTVTAYPLNGQQERSGIGPISFINGEIEAEDKDLIIFGTVFGTYENDIAPLYDTCDDIVTEGPQSGRYVLENYQLIGPAIKTGNGPDGGTDFGPAQVIGFNYNDSYEIIETGFDTILKINATSEYYPQCCVTQNGTCEGQDTSVINNSGSNSYIIKAANDQGFVIESDGYYVVFMKQ